MKGDSQYHRVPTRIVYPMISTVEFFQLHVQAKIFEEERVTRISLSH